MYLDRTDYSSVGRGQMSFAETRLKSAVETEQMSSSVTRQTYHRWTGQRSVCDQKASDLSQQKTSVLSHQQTSVARHSRH